MLAIVPARGNSKGIPRKNLRVLHGVPLVLRTLQTLATVPQLERIVVSTEDPTIAALAELHGFEVATRPLSLAADDITVGQVVDHHVRDLGWEHDVAVFQPTSPCLSSATVTKAIDAWQASGADSLMTVQRSDHVTWDWRPDRQPVALTPHVNRQQLHDGLWVETGGMALCRRKVLHRYVPARVVSDQPMLYPLEWPESIDIDTHADLETARLALGRRRITFVVSAGPRTGSGHVHRALALADELSHHDVRVEFEEQADWATRLVDAHGYLREPDGLVSDLVVFDKLDTSAREVTLTQACGSKVVTFEDRGTGADHADLVINELYPPNGDPRRLTGPAWSVLRPEFLNLAPTYRDKGEHLLITFGGTDPAGLTERCAHLLQPWKPRVVVPPGREVHNLHNVTYVEGPNMARELVWADLAVTSCGRTVHEAAACGTPVVALAANVREEAHVHVPGSLYMGSHVRVPDHLIIDVVRTLMANPMERAERGRAMHAAIDGLGVRRIARRLEDLLEAL